MSRRQRRLRRSLAGGVLVAGLGGALGLHGNAATTPSNADVFLINGPVSVTTPLAIGLSGSRYNLTGNDYCTVNAPVVGGLVPTYLDLPGAQLGACGGVTGSGSLTDVVGCTTGQISGDWLISEPGGDTAEFNGAGILVGGVAIMATGALDGYTDDNRSGQGAAVAVLTPALDGGIPSGCSTTLALTSVVAGAY